MEAAGRQRVEGLDALFVHVDKTTRSAQEKLDKLRQWIKKMRSDPRFWPQLFERDRPVSVLVKKIVDESRRPVTRRDVERKFGKHRKIPSTGLSQELKELANRGEIDRLKLGVYWRRGTASAAYESDLRRMYRLVYCAPDHRMREAELAVALGLSRGDTGSLVSLLRKRGLFAPATGNGVVVASAESLATLQRGPIFDGRGGIFFTAQETVAPLHAAVFTTLRPERPRVDREARAQKLASLRTLKGEQMKSAVAITAKELACDPEDLIERLPKSAQRYLRNETARERWREKLTRMMKESPKRSPKPLPDLFKDAHEAGVSRRVCKDMIREVTAVLRQEGLEASWSDPGAPKRG
jgi:hypothetical protein